MKYTKDYRMDDYDIIMSHLSALRGKPDCRYLEIGVFEGRSLLGRMSDLFTHPSCRAVGVDSWRCPGWKESRHQRIKGNAYANLEGRDRITLLEMTGLEAMIDLDLESFDLVYIDADHRSFAVFADACTAWCLVKKGGYMLFDDTGEDYWRNADGDGPLRAVRRFLVCTPTATVLHMGKQTLLRKD